MLTRLNKSDHLLHKPLFYFEKNVYLLLDLYYDHQPHKQTYHKLLNLDQFFLNFDISLRYGNDSAIIAKFYKKNANAKESKERSCAN